MNFSIDESEYRHREPRQRKSASRAEAKIRSFLLICDSVVHFPDLISVRPRRGREGCGRTRQKGGPNKLRPACRDLCIGDRRYCWLVVYGDSVDVPFICQGDCTVLSLSTSLAAYHMQYRLYNSSRVIIWTLRSWKLMLPATNDRFT